MWNGPLLLRTLEELNRPAYLCTISGHRIGLMPEELLAIATSRVTIGFVLVASGIMALLSCCVLGVETSLFMRLIAWIGLLTSYVACIFGLFRLAQFVGVRNRHSYVLMTIGLQLVFAVLILSFSALLISTNPMPEMPFKAHLTLIVLRNMAVLLVFEFILVNYAWVPTLASYKNLHEIYQHKVSYLDNRGSICIIRMFMARIGKPIQNKWVSEQ